MALQLPLCFEGWAVAPVPAAAVILAPQGIVLQALAQPLGVNLTGYAVFLFNLAGCQSLYDFGWVSISLAMLCCCPYLDIIPLSMPAAQAYPVACMLHPMYVRGIVPNHCTFLFA